MLCALLTSPLGLPGLRSPLFSSLPGPQPQDQCPNPNDVYVEITNEQPNAGAWNACGDVIFPTRPSTYGNPPAVFQNNNCYQGSSAAAMFDFALVGAGIGSAYVINEVRFVYTRLSPHCRHASMHPPTGAVQAGAVAHHCSVRGGRDCGRAPRLRLPDRRIRTL